MAKRYTYEYVRDYIVSYSYKLLTPTYKDNKTKLQVECPKKHRYWVTFSDFKNNGRRCSKCAGVAKFTFEEVKVYVDATSETLLSMEYVNCDTKLDFMCLKGHKYSMSFSTFKKGHRCSKCAGNALLLYEDIKQFVEMDGTKLLSSEYKNNNTKLDFMCPEGHEYSMIFNNFKSKGQRCPECAGNVKFTIEEIKLFIGTTRETLLSTTYINSKAKLDFVCPKGHKYSMKFDNFKHKGYRCPVCGGRVKYTYEEVKAYVEKDGTKLRSTEYITCKTKLEFICPKGHEYFMSFDRFKNKGRRCPRCSGGPVSKISQVWLDDLNMLGLEREYPITVASGKMYSVDGCVPLTKEIREFLGDIWHGNLTIYDSNDINPISKISYGQLHKETFERFAELKAAGWKIKYIWESDFREGKEMEEFKGIV
jgi:uncharacterized protein with PIN domain